MPKPDKKTHAESQERKAAGSAVATDPVIERVKAVIPKLPKVLAGIIASYLRPPWLNLNDKERTVLLASKNFKDIDFTGLKDFSRFDFIDANFSGADLSGAYLSKAILTRAKFSGADLSDADLSSAFLRDVDLRGVDLFGTDLSGADLCHANLSGVDLPGAKFKRANLQHVCFSGANLSGANLSEARLYGADFSGADLSAAFLPSADLRYADLRAAGLRGADLSGADLSRADLRGADLRSADLRGANLYKTKLPAYLNSGFGKWTLSKEADIDDPIAILRDYYLNIYSKQILARLSLQSRRMKNGIEKCLQKTPLSQKDAEDTFSSLKTFIQTEAKKDIKNHAKKNELFKCFEHIAIRNKMEVTDDKFMTFLKSTLPGLKDLIVPVDAEVIAESKQQSEQGKTSALAGLLPGPDDVKESAPPEDVHKEEREPVSGEDKKDKDGISDAQALALVGTFKTPSSAPASASSSASSASASSSALSASTSSPPIPQPDELVDTRTSEYGVSSS